MSDFRRNTYNRLVAQSLGSVYQDLRSAGVGVVNGHAFYCGSRVTRIERQETFDEKAVLALVETIGSREGLYLTLDLYSE